MNKWISKIEKLGCDVRRSLLLLDVYPFSRPNPGLNETEKALKQINNFTSQFLVNSKPEAIILPFCAPRPLASPLLLSLSLAVLAADNKNRFGQHTRFFSGLIFVLLRTFFRYWFNE